MALFAQESTGTPLDFLNFGLTGLVIVGFLMGWLWARPAVDGIRKDKERAEGQVDALLSASEERTNSLVKATVAIDALRPLIEEMVRALDNHKGGASDGQPR